MSELPKGWTEATLGDLGRYLNGRGFKKSEWAESGRPIIRIQNLTGTSDEFNYFEGEADERHVVRKGDLLVSWAATLGVYKWTGEEAVLNQHIFKVESHIDPDFHRYLVQHALDDLYSQAHGSGMVHITKGKFDSTPVLLPPLAEQERIVAAIERHLSHLDAAEDAARRAGRNLERLTAAIRGLAFDLRWATAPLGDLGQIVTGSTPNSKDPELWDGPVPFVTPGDIPHGCVVKQSARSLTEAGGASARMVKSDSVLVTCIGATIGKAGYTERPVATNQQINSVTPNPKVLDPRFLLYALTSPGGQRLIMDNSSSTTMPILNKGRFSKLELPVPPLQVQARTVADIESALESLAATRSSVGRATRRGPHVRRAVLAAAFSGELVEQDPADESAFELLDRIRAANPARKSSRREASA